MNRLRTTAHTYDSVRFNAWCVERSRKCISKSRIFVFDNVSCLLYEWRSSVIDVGRLNYEQRHADLCIEFYFERNTVPRSSTS